MDLLYHRYASPMDLISSYINRGQFGKFVTSFLEAEYERKKEEAEKDVDWKLWVYYTQCVIKGLTEESFADWKKRFLGSADNKDKRKANRDNELTDDGINAIIADLFPE